MRIFIDSYIWHDGAKSNPSAPTQDFHSLELTSDKNDGPSRQTPFLFSLARRPSVLWHMRHPRRKTRVFMRTDKHLSSARRHPCVHGHQFFVSVG